MAVRSDTRTRPSRQRQPKGPAAAQAGSIPNTARDMLRKVPPELAEKRRREAEALDGLAERRDVVDFGIRIMPVAVFVSSLFGWDPHFLTDANIEIQEDGQIVTQRKVREQLHHLKLGKVPEHLAFILPPPGLGDRLGWIVGDPKAIEEVRRIIDSVESLGHSFDDLTTNTHVLDGEAVNHEAV